MAGIRYKEIRSRKSVKADVYSFILQKKGKNKQKC